MTTNKEETSYNPADAKYQGGVHLPFLTRGGENEGQKSNQILDFDTWMT